MVRKIGNFFVFFFLVFLHTLYGENGIKLIITDMNGKVVHELKRGAPYLFEVRADGDHKMHDVVIPGLKNIYHEFRGASRITMMSKVTTQHTYLIRSNSVGTFELGPAKIKGSHGHELRSDILSFKVSEDQQQEVILELLSSGASIVPGEKCTLTIRLNTRVPTELISLEHPNLDPTIGTLSPLQQIQRGSTTIHNVSYEFAEWQTELTAKKPGRLTMPPFKAICKTLQKNGNRSHDLFTAIMNRFTMHSNPQHYVSNDLTIFVDSLPFCDRDVHGMGVFSDFRAALQHEKAHVGEGIVLTLSVLCKTHPDELKAPKLKLPEGLKYYESKTIFEEGNAQFPYKILFEYIVQGMKEGVYEIPPNFFTFFNTATRCYETLETNPIFLNILPPYVARTQQNNEMMHDGTLHDGDDIHPIRETGSWIFQRERALSWYWFFIFIFLPFIYCCYVFGIQYYYDYQKTHRMFLDRKYAFAIAKKRLRTSVDDRAPQSMYDIFMHLFAARFGLSQTELSAEGIERLLREKGFSKEALEQWHRFFYAIQECAFLKKHTMPQEQELVKRAQVWLKQLEEKI